MRFARAQEENDAPALAQPEQFRTLRGLGGSAALLAQQGVDTALRRYWAQQGATPVLLAVCAWTPCATTALTPCSGCGRRDIGLSC